MGLSASPRLLDLFHGGKAHSVPFGDEALWTRRVNGDLVSLFGSQLRPSATTHVHKVGHGFKMIGVTASALAAKVIKFKSGWYVAMLHHPCHSVRPMAARDSVSGAVFASVPDPAWGGEPTVNDCVEILAPFPSLSSGVVRVDEPDRFSLHPSPRLHRLGSERRWVAASAFAEFRRLFSHVGLLPRLTLGGSGAYRSSHSILLGAPC